MNRRIVTKFVVKLVVTTAISSVVSRVLSVNIPATNNYKVADMAGVFTGWYAGERLEPKINAAVDNFYTKREAK